MSPAIYAAARRSAALRSTDGYRQIRTWMLALSAGQMCSGQGLLADGPLACPLRHLPYYFR